MTVSAVLLGTYFAIQPAHGDPVASWLMIAAVFGYVGSFAIGVGPIPWLLMAEIFPADVRGTACTLATVVNWSGSFLVTLSCDALTKLLDYKGLFFLYAAVCLMGVVYTSVLVVETKGKSLEEITSMLSGTRGGNPMVNPMLSAPLAPIISSPTIPKSPK